MKSFTVVSVFLLAARVQQFRATPAADSYVLSLENNSLEPETTTGRPQLPGVSHNSASISSLHIHSSIRFRYSTTLITSHATNSDPYNPKEIGFEVLLPNSAYISKFIMEIDGSSYEAHVKKKDEARSVYEQAKVRGQTGGLVEVSARDANLFQLSINLKPSSKIVFNLTYEEILVRKLGRYEQIINVRPEHLRKIPDFGVHVVITESQNITELRVPKLESMADLKTRVMRRTKDNGNASQPLDPSDVRNILVSRHGPTVVLIEWIPSTAEMRAMSLDNTKFVVQYDVVRPNAGGEILLMNGYFVHFFAPNNLLPLRKHVIFVLDISGSMAGRKIEQLRNAMKFILDDLKPDDYFNIITFSSEVKGWNPIYLTLSEAYRSPILATEENLRKGHQFMNNLTAFGWTNINAGLHEALNVALSATAPPNVEPVILFLTDGEPTVGVTEPIKIYENVRKKQPAKVPVPIYGLAFGDDADFEFVKKLALQNGGFGRKIYESGDSDLQLQGFYKEISSPMLSGAMFRYTAIGGIEDLTKVWYSKLFEGSEVVVAGRLKSGTAAANVPIVVDIDGLGRNGRVSVGGSDVAEFDIVPRPRPTRSNTGRGKDDGLLERLWAYLTIKQLIDRDIQGIRNGLEDSDESQSDETLLAISSGATGNEQPREKAIRLALKYKFVTPLTSLVVTTPNDTKATNCLTEAPAPPVTRVTSVSTPAPVHTQKRPLPYVPDLGSDSPSCSNCILPASTMSTAPTTNSPDDNDIFMPIRHLNAKLAIPRERELRGLLGANMQMASATGDQPSSTQSTTTTQPSTTQSTTTTQPATTQSTTTTMTTTTGPTRTLKLSLDDISWLPNTMNNYGPLWINGTAYSVDARRRSGVKTMPSKCSRLATTSSSRRDRVVAGECKHLKDCVLQEFVNDVHMYYDTFFCPLRSRNSVLYAGVCC